MRNSEIIFKVALDQNNVPEKITWEASDAGDDQAETKSLSISLWDHLQKNTLRIDLWTKDMPVDEMKKYYIDTLGGLSQSMLTSTGDTFMSEELKKLCDKLATYLQKENK